MKYATSFRLKEETLRLLALLADHLQISQASTVEMLIWERARREGVSEKKKGT